MLKLITNNQHVFDVEYAGPIDFAGTGRFSTRIKNSSMDEVHDTFRYPENTQQLTYEIWSEDVLVESVVYTGYTKYLGFNIVSDGSIIVLLQKDFGA